SARVRSRVLRKLDLVRLDQRVRQQLLAHPLQLGPSLLAVAVLELEVDDPADARVADREAELLERAEHRFSLRVEDARLWADEDGCSHARTTEGSSR